jgi:hypothetical protein
VQISWEGLNSAASPLSTPSCCAPGSPRRPVCQGEPGCLRDDADRLVRGQCRRAPAYRFVPPYGRAGLRGLHGAMARVDRTEDFPSKRRPARRGAHRRFRTTSALNEDAVRILWGERDAWLDPSAARPLRTCSRTRSWSSYRTPDTFVWRTPLKG